MRNLKRPLNVHLDHTSAVIDVAYSPTGREFVSGSYDKTLRIFGVDQVNILSLIVMLLF
jgi:WD repeat and SOF domain-containing protein 1